MMEDLKLEEVRGSLASLSLTSVILGDYLVVTNSDFDVFINGEPYLALMVLLNKKSGIYKAKLWNQTICSGKKPTAAEFVQICKQHFSQNKPCIGFPQELDEQSQYERPLSQTPIPRKVSKDCLKFLKDGFGDDDNSLCCECKKLSVSKALKDVTVVLKGDAISSGDPETLLSPKLEQKEDIETDIPDSVEDYCSAIADSPVTYSVLHEDGNNLNPVSLHFSSGDSRDTYSKKCPWCKKQITWSGQSDIFQEHRKSCLLLVLKKNPVKRNVDKTSDLVFEHLNSDAGSEYQEEHVQEAIQETSKCWKKSLEDVKQSSMNDTNYCAVCKKHFKSEASWTLHKKFVHFWGIFNCPSCHEEFNFVKDLIKHIKEDSGHSEDTNINCPACKDDFSFTNIESHYRRCIVAQIQRENFPIHEGLQNPNLHNNITSDISNQVAAQLQKVKKSLKATLERERAAGQRVICSQCGKNFKNERMLSKHNRIHQREQGAKVDETTNKPLYFPCDQCEKQFLSKEGWRLHTRLVHEGMNEHATCEVCGVTFITKERLRRHKILHHSTDERFNCKYCEKRCSTKAWLARHVARQHEEPKFKCGFCDRSFKFKEKLEGHENEHKGVKPYSCSKCEACYYSKDGLRNHHRKKHAK